MLTELHVRDLALVEDVWLEFGPGLTVLTGETGAGKTVLVSALKLLLGDRADSTLVREGASEALVEGRFLLDGSEVVVKRRVTAEGRSRCTIDGEMATVTMLADLLGPQVDLHGQHEHQALLSPPRHAAYLDRFAGASATDALGAYRLAWQEWQSARRGLQELESALHDRDRKADYLRFQVADIDAVSTREGEYEELEGRLPKLRHGERLASAANAALAALKDDEGASDRLSLAQASLVAAQGLDPALDQLANAVRDIDVQLQDVGASLRSYAESIEHDPGALDTTERRLQQLTDVMRKYGGDIASVLQTREAAARELELLEDGDAGLERARADVAATETVLRETAAALSTARASAVEPFTSRLAEAAADLSLPNATFAVEVTGLPFESWTADGPERIEFQFSPATGESPRPLAKVASGGEVSRVMLALKSVLGAADAVPVLVFDEVDAGIGGATALSVGKRLADLSADHQVLVVTHLPQVAAYASAHIVVEKAEAGDRTVTTAKRIAGDAIVIEVARMLSGGSSATGLAHARELLDMAAGPAKG